LVGDASRWLRNIPTYGAVRYPGCIAASICFTTDNRARSSTTFWCRPALTRG
jgi:hypothetical protein